MYTTSHTVFECAIEAFVRTARVWGLTVNIDKTKGLVAGRHSEEVVPVHVASGSLQVTVKFTHKMTPGSKQMY